MTERRQRILQIAHNHPRFHAGGTELTALALHRQALAEGFDSWFLGALDDTQTLPNQGTQMIGLTADQREAALFTTEFRRFPLAQDDHYGFLREFRDYLEYLRPDVVHVHHILNFGLEALHLIRNTLPEVRVVLTLHDYYLICAYNGQLYKHETRERCAGPVLQHCLNCFPERTATDFAMRALNIRNALGLVDRIVSPSDFLKRKFEAHISGLPEIVVVENGYLGDQAAAVPAPVGSAGDMAFGYFGNISAIKGLADLLDAAELIFETGRTDFRLHVHGSQLFEDKLLFDRMERARDTLGKHARFHGAYRPEDTSALLDATDCLVFPSVWWENAPLVIYEALAHGRQVISYPHGGAPEILARHGMGVIAERSDPAALAEAMTRVLDDRALARRTPSPPVPLRAATLAAYKKLYFG